MKRAFFILGLTIIAANLSFGQSMAKPMKASESPDRARWAQVAMGPEGDVHICWEEEDLTGPGHEIMYSYYDGKEWTSPVKLINAPALKGVRPHIACNRNSVVAVVWSQVNDSHFVREYDPVQKKWLPAFKLGGAAHEIDEQAVAVDPDDNIYAIWYENKTGDVFSRSKINGTWEEAKRMSHPTRSNQVDIAAGKDGWVWAIWREKQQAIGKYRIFWSKRNKNTDWTDSLMLKEKGGSHTHPHIGVGPAGVAHVVTQELYEEGPSEVYCITIDEDTNPRELVVPERLQHYPRIAIDKDGNKHVACQTGAGDNGRAVIYTNNIGGTWNGAVAMPNSAGWLKTPSIAADAYGNVALVWAAAGEVWFTSLYPVVKKVFYPPVGLSASLSFSGDDVVYSLNWKKNSKNLEEYVEGYNIYKKETAGAAFEKILSVTKNTLSASFTYAEVKPSIAYRISTVSLSGQETGMEEFDIRYPQIKSPTGLMVSIAVDNVRGTAVTTYSLDWQANSQNHPTFVKGYKLYKKEGSGNFVLLESLSKTASSYTYTSDSQSKIQFALSTTSVMNTESAMVVFGSQ